MGQKKRNETTRTTLGKRGSEGGEQISETTRILNVIRENKEKGSSAGILTFG